MNKWGPWIIALAILLAAGGVVGYLAWQNSSENACEEWQARASDLLEGAEDGDYTMPYEDDPVFQSRAARVGDRPDGCPVP